MSLWQPQAWLDGDWTTALAAMPTPTRALEQLGRAVPNARHLADTMVYSLDRLTASERVSLSAALSEHGRDARPASQSVIAVRPRSLRVYERPEGLLGTNDALARVATVVPPGVGPLGAAAFAREAALALGEPVLTVVPNYDAADYMAELLGVVSMSAGRRDDEKALRPEAETLLTLLNGRAANVRLVVGHGGGAFVAADLLEKVAHGEARGDGAGIAPRRLISFGAAPTTPHGCDAFAIVGAADAYGWLFVEPEAWVFEAPFATGHHFNRMIPGHIELRRHLLEVEKDAPFLTAPSRPKPMRGSPMIAPVAD